MEETKYFSDETKKLLDPKKKSGNGEEEEEDEWWHPNFFSKKINAFLNNFYMFIWIKNVVYKVSSK